MYKHIPFKSITNKLLLNKVILPTNILPYIEDQYFNNHYIDYRKNNNYSPILYTFPNFNELIRSSAIINNNKKTISPQLGIHFQQDYNLILPKGVNKIQNQIYYRNISNSHNTMILGRFWFKYIQSDGNINFVSIYEITDNIQNVKDKNMNKYWRAINTNKVFPKFDKHNENDITTFIKNIQDLY